MPVGPVTGRRWLRRSCVPHANCRAIAVHTVHTVHTVRTGIGVQTLRIESQQGGEMKTAMEGATVGYDPGEELARELRSLARDEGASPTQMQKCPSLISALGATDAVHAVQRLRAALTGLLHG